MKDLCKFEHLENASFLYHLRIFISLLKHLNFFSFLGLYLSICCVSIELQPFDSKLNIRLSVLSIPVHSVEV